MYRILVEHRIAQNKENYKCFLCRFNVPNTYEGILDHINSDYHKEWAEIHKWDRIKANKKLENLMKLSETEYKKIVKNGIVYKGTHFTCNYCNSSENSSVDQHLLGKKHKRNYKDIDVPLTNDTNIIIESVIDSILHKDFKKEWSLSTLPTLGRKNRRANHIQFNEAANTYECEICHILFDGPLKTSAHIIGSSHLENLKQHKISKLIKTQINPETNNDITGKDLFYYCEKCDVYLTLNEILVQCHCLLHLHDELPIVYGEETNVNFDIMEVIFIDDDVIIKCLLCDRTMDSDEKLAEHIISPRHFEKLDMISIMSNIKDRYVHERDRKNHKCNIDNYTSDFISIKNFCTTCFSKPDLDESDHFQKIKPVQKSNIENVDHSHISISENMAPYRCFLCNRPYVTLKSLLFHFTLRGHLRSVQNFHAIIQDTAFKNDEIKIDDLLKKLEEKNRSDREKRILKFPYNKDILDFGERYITKCLEPGNDNIYNIDYDRVCQFHLGASLTLKSKSGVLCLVCNYKFSDRPLFLYDHLQHEVHITNLRAVEKEDEENQNRFSFLDLEKSFMIQEKSDESVKCLICNITIPNYDDDIETHMKSNDHVSKIEIHKKITGLDDKIENISKMFKDIWYYADRFNCNVCYIRIHKEISFIKHLEEPEHIEKAKASKAENKINVCFVCSLCWYGSSDYSQHYADVIHKNSLVNCNSSKQPPKSKEIYKMLKFIDDYILLFVSESDKIFDEKEKEQILLESIEETVKHKYPNAKAYAFGSRNSYLGFPESDVDVFLDCENIYNNIGVREDSTKYITKLTNEFLNRRKDIWQNDIILLHSRVPIMKLYHKALDLKCDISFLSGLGVEKSKLIRTYVIADKDSDQIIRSLILILKKWFTFCDLYGPQAICAYAISWFAIFYLQTIDILPSVHQLIRLKNESKIVDGWQCGFPETIPKIIISYTVKELLKGFFEYYYQFDYQTNLVCPLLGKVLKKRTFANIQDLPEEMEIYKQRLSSEELELFSFVSPMCIQDPVDLSQNITKAITKIELRNFREYCKQSYDFIVESEKSQEFSN